jgi:hypothetical protein
MTLLLVCAALIVIALAVTAYVAAPPSYMRERERDGGAG